MTLKAPGHRVDQLVNAGVVERGVHCAVHRRFELLGRRGPVRAEIRFPGGFLHVGVGTLAAQRPGTDQGLPHQRREGGVGHGCEGLQFREELRPVSRHLGEHRDPGAGVLAALGVVGAQGGHGQRVAGLPLQEAAVHLEGVDGEDRRVGSHLVERDQPGVPVERGVLHALGHHHAGGLLEAPGQRIQLGVRRSLEERVEQRVEGLEGGTEVRTPHLGVPHGVGEVVGALGQVAPVDGEAGQELGEGICRRFGVEACALRHEPGQAKYFGVQDAVRDAPLGSVDHLVERLHGHQRRELVFARGVGEQAVDVGERVVAGGPFTGPVSRELLARLEDLLDQDVGAAGQLAEILEVTHRVGEAVGVVDAQAVHESVVEPAPHLAVALLEHPRNLHAEACEGVDAEEAPVVELAVGAAPVHEFVVLLRVHVGGRIARSERALRNGIAVVVVAELSVHHLECGFLLRSVAQHGDADPPARGVPVDVERFGHPGSAALLQELPPPGVAGRRLDAHVVGHDVHQHPQPRPAGGGAQLDEGFAAAACGVHGGGVGHVVAVAGPLLRGQDGRQVHPVHPEVMQVRHQGRGFPQIEFVPDLQPVGRFWCLHACPPGELGCRDG